MLRALSCRFFSRTAILVCPFLAAVSGCGGGGSGTNAGPATLTQSPVGDAIVLPPAVPFDTGNIVFAGNGQQVIDGKVWNYDVYENRALECAEDPTKYQNFVFSYQATDDLSDPGLTWLRLHGGGACIFRSADNPHWITKDPFSTDRAFNCNVPSRVPTPFTAGEDPTVLFSAIMETGLVERARNSTEKKVRFLFASDCDWNFYAGYGQGDPYNHFYPDNKMEGLIHTISTVKFVRDLYGSLRNQSQGEKLVCHGTSAGSFGCAVLAAGLERERLDDESDAGLSPLDAVIADSGIPATKYYVQSEESCRTTPTEDLDNIFIDPVSGVGRAGEYVWPEAFQTHQLMNDGLIPDTSAWFNIYSMNDTSCTCQAPEDIDTVYDANFEPAEFDPVRESPSGSVIGCDRVHGDIKTALEARTSAAPSRVLRLCVHADQNKGLSPDANYQEIENFYVVNSALVESGETPESQAKKSFCSVHSPTRHNAAAYPGRGNDPDYNSQIWDELIQWLFPVI